MQNKQQMIGTYGLGLSLVLLMIFVEWQRPLTFSLWRYERYAVQAGDWYRLLSNPWTHLTSSHTWHNLIALALIWVGLGWFFELWELLLLTVLGSILVGLGFLIWSPELEWYVGSSGMINLYLVALCIRIGMRTRKWLRLVGVVVLVASVLRVLWEQSNGALPGSVERTGGVVIVDAHLYGILSGLLLMGVVGVVDRFFFQSLK